MVGKAGFLFSKHWKQAEPAPNKFSKHWKNRLKKFQTLEKADQQNSARRRSV